jgi:hypothetical protein
LAQLLFTPLYRLNQGESSMIKRENELFISKVFENISNSIKKQTSGMYLEGLKAILEQKLRRSGNNINSYCTSLLNNVIYFRELLDMYTLMFLSYTYNEFPSNTEYSRQSAFVEQTVKNKISSKYSEYLSIYNEKYRNQHELREALEFDYMYYNTIYQLSSSFVDSLVNNKREAASYISSFKQENPINLRNTFLKYCQLYTNGLIGNLSFF